MHSFGFADSAPLVKIETENCPQCRFGERVCVGEPGEHGALSFLVCPQCGRSEETWRGETTVLPGHGVWVVRGKDGVVKAGAHPSAVSPEDAPEIVSEYLRHHAATVNVTCWNPRKGRLEVLLGE